MRHLDADVITSIYVLQVDGSDVLPAMALSQSNPASSPVHTLLEHAGPHPITNSYLECALRLSGGASIILSPA